jgi:hypothetical protein
LSRRGESGAPRGPRCESRRQQTRDGRPVAAVVTRDAADAYGASLTNNPDFIAIIERGRAQLEAHRSFSLSEMRRKHGFAQAKKPKVRKTA